MAFALFTLLIALTMSGLAAWYSIQGLVAIYAGMPLIVMLLAGIIEIGKLAAVSWVYQTWNWSRTWIKSLLSVFIVGVMIVTSIGIYGLLNKAHQDIAAKSNNDILKIERIDEQIESEKNKIKRLNTTIIQLDKSIEIYFKKEYITRGLRERDKQLPQRIKINNAIDQHNIIIDNLIDKKQPMLKKLKELEQEIGPLKAVAELIYGEKDAKNYFDNAVRWLTILLVFIFDPFAVTLVMAANMSIAHSRISNKKPIINHVVDKVVNKVNISKKKNIKKNTKNNNNLFEEISEPVTDPDIIPVETTIPTAFVRNADPKEAPQPKVEEIKITRTRDADWYDRWKKKQAIDFNHVEEEVTESRINPRKWIDPLIPTKK